MEPMHVLTVPTKQRWYDLITCNVKCNERAMGSIRASNLKVHDVRRRGARA